MLRRFFVLAGLLFLASSARAEVFESWPGTTYQWGDRFWFHRNQTNPALPTAWAVSGGSVTSTQDVPSGGGNFHVIYATGICPNVYGEWDIPFTMSDNAEGGDVGVWIGVEPYDGLGSDPNSAVWFDLDTAHDLGVRTEAGPGGVAHYCGTDQNFATGINIRDGLPHTIHLNVSASDITFMIDDSTEVCSAVDMGVGPFNGTPTMLALGFFARDTDGAVTDSFGEITWDRDEPEEECAGNRFYLFKPASAGKDNLLLGGSPNLNLGTNEALASRADTNSRTVIEFDLSGIDPEEVCVSASLTLTARTSGAGGTHNINALRVGNDGWTEAGSTWNKQDGTNDWAGSAGASTSGTDFTAETMGTFTASTVVPADKIISLDCDHVQPWFGNAANYGAVIWNDSGAGDQFFASDVATPIYRPQLIVEVQGDEEPVISSVSERVGRSWRGRRRPFRMNNQVGN